MCKGGWFFFPTQCSQDIFSLRAEREDSLSWWHNFLSIGLDIWDYCPQFSGCCCFISNFPDAVSTGEWQSPQNTWRTEMATEMLFFSHQNMSNVTKNTFKVDCWHWGERVATPVLQCWCVLIIQAPRCIWNVLPKPWGKAFLALTA